VRTTAPGYVLALLTVLSFFNYLDRMVIAILVEPIKRDLGLTDTQVGLVSGFAFAVLFAVLGLPLARFADRRSRVALVSASLALWSAMTALTGTARNFLELFTVRVAVGIGEAGCMPASHSLIGDLFPAQRRVFAISILQAGGYLGQRLGLALAGAAAQVWGWRVAVVIAGLLGVPLALIMLFTVHEPPRGETHSKASEEPVGATVKVFVTTRPLLHIVMGISVAAFGSFGMAQWIPAYFVRLYGLSLTEVGLYSGGTAALGAVLGTLFGGYVVGRLNRHNVRWELWWPMIVFALFPLFILPSFLVADWKLALGWQLIAFFVGASGGGVAMSSAQTYVAPHRRAMAIAIILLASSLLGLGLGPVAVGVLSDLLAPHLGIESLRYALIATTVIPFWAAVHFFLAARASRRWNASTCGSLVA